MTLPPRPRLSDVARAAGVSLGTASNAFNRPHLVRPEIRERVEQSATALGYAGPDPAGRLLMGGKANAIGVLPPGNMMVAPALRSPFFREFLQGVAQVCDDYGSSVLVISGEHERKAWAIRNALVDGFVLGHSEEVALVAERARPVPCVVMDMPAPAGTAAIGIEAEAGAAMAARHLLDLGHRRLAIVSVARRPGPPILHQPGSPPSLTSGFPIDQAKLAGYAAALQAGGFDIADMLLFECYPHQPWADESAEIVLDNLGGATAVLAMSDRNARAIVAAAAARGLRVPEQLSVVGFDDSPDALAAQPALTTIHQPLVEKGRLAAAALLGGDTRQLMLPVHLVTRSSTAPPSGG